MSFFRNTCPCFVSFIDYFGENIWKKKWRFFICGHIFTSVWMPYLKFKYWIVSSLLLPGCCKAPFVGFQSIQTTLYSFINQHEPTFNLSKMIEGKTTYHHNNASESTNSYKKDKFSWEKQTKSNRGVSPWQLSFSWKFRNVDKLTTYILKNRAVKK